MISMRMLLEAQPAGFVRQYRSCENRNLLDLIRRRFVVACLAARLAVHQAIVADPNINH